MSRGCCHSSEVVPAMITGRIIGGSCAHPGYAHEGSLARVLQDFAGDGLDPWELDTEVNAGRLGWRVSLG